MISVWLSVLSDLFINLSAGWFGAAVILPLYTNKQKIRSWALMINIVFGILSLLASVVIRSRI